MKNAHYFFDNLKKELWFLKNKFFNSYLIFDTHNEEYLNWNGSRTKTLSEASDFFIPLPLLDLFCRASNKFSKNGSYLRVKKVFVPTLKIDASISDFLSSENLVRIAHVHHTVYGTECMTDRAYEYVLYDKDVQVGDFVVTENFINDKRSLSIGYVSRISFLEDREKMPHSIVVSRVIASGAVYRKPMTETEFSEYYNEEKQ